MHSAKRVFRALLVVLPLLCYGSVLGAAIDDEIPEVTARVARATFVKGDVQVRRAGSADWEQVSQDLPFVEGDEIATGDESRLEVQLDSKTFLRLDENSYLNVAGLKDGGVALSLPKGTLIVRALAFNKDDTYIEVDAPKTTVSVQKAGVYRVEAGDRNEEYVRVSVTEDGEARIYSENAGFTLRSGRSSRIAIAGGLAGEWTTSDAGQYVDEFDRWALDRDKVIEDRLASAYYDEYYDRDVFGAEDLGDNGEWIHTQQYGYVWRPYTSATGRYSNWSPYRYGEWRWVPPFGWTWVNDEPWGWATYHYGRWIYYNGYWAWTPYGSHRGGRSWWRPALVVVRIYNNNVCWYPLPYSYGYYDFNYYSGGHRHRGHGGNPTPSPSPTPAVVPGRRPPNRLPIEPVEAGGVPPGGVVSVPVKDFGAGRKSFGSLPPAAASAVLSKLPTDAAALPQLPAYSEVRGRMPREIGPLPPVIAQNAGSTKTGASTRDGSGPLDPGLQKTRIYGGRLPVQRDDAPPAGKPLDRGGSELPETGAVKPPVRVQPPTREVTPDATPKPPEPRVEPKYEPRQPVEPKPRESPRIEPPKREDPKPREVPRVEPPRNDGPKPEPPQREKPPQKVEPRQDDSKPAPSKTIERKKGD
jgi:hypothetical protein